MIAPFVRRFAVGLVLPALVSGAASAGLLVDADPDWREDAYVLPAPPQEGSLRPFFVSEATPNRFLLDVATLAIGGDGVVRYVLVIRTPGGAESVTFEGIRCNTGERRIYASGRKDGSWVAMKNSAWAPIVHNSYNRPRAALAKDVFCDGPAPPRDRGQVLRRLDGIVDFTDPLRGGR